MENRISGIYDAEWIRNAEAEVDRIQGMIDETLSGDVYIVVIDGKVFSRTVDQPGVIPDPVIDPPEDGSPPDDNGDHDDGDHPDDDGDHPDDDDGHDDDDDGHDDDDDGHDDDDDGHDDDDDGH